MTPPKHTKRCILFFSMYIAIAKEELILFLKNDMKITVYLFVYLDYCVISLDRKYRQ